MGLSLTLERVRELARDYALIPLCLDVIADLETPVTAYLKVARGPYSFLLESVEGGERLAHYSFIGTEPRAVLRFTGGGGKRRDAQGQRTAFVGGDPLPLFRDTVLAFDHVAHRIKITTHVRPAEHGSVEAAYEVAFARLMEIVARLRAPLPDAAITPLPPVLRMQ